MKNLQSAWKLFFTMIKQSKLIWVALFLTLLGIAMMVLVGIEGEAVGEEEHLLSASFTSFGYYMTFLGFSFVFTGFTNNRFFMSCPEAKRVFTHILPLFGAAMNLLLFAISVVSVIVCGHSAQMLSDVLLFNALGVAITQLSIAFVTVQTGFIITYICFFPYLMLIFTVENTTNELLRRLHLYGFGVPVEISAVIYAVVAIVFFVASFKIAEGNYSKRSVRLINAAAQYSMVNK